MDLNSAQNLIEQYVKDLIDTCPHCGAKVHIEKLWNAHHSFDNGDVEFYVILDVGHVKNFCLKHMFSDKIDIQAKLN